MSRWRVKTRSKTEAQDSEWPLADLLVGLLALIGMFRANKGESEDAKAPSAGAKSLCIPYDQKRFGELASGQKCIQCGAVAKSWTMFGRSEYTR